ncbi:MAG: Ribulose-phosphate 3-epimerase [Myxococcota bacterium]|nr:Ribulose-phosphate 3-epimerase [Myxococcota bacterium]
MKPWKGPGPAIAPSILSADFSRLGDEVRAVEAAGADWIHVDVMDGRFVPNITIGPLVVKALRKVTRLPLDVHLMIVEPDRYTEEFILAGADVVTIHAEAAPHLHRALTAIREQGERHPPAKTGRVFEQVGVGVSVNPHTPVSQLRHVLHVCDLVLIMSVNPGFGGQNLIPECLKKCVELAEIRAREGHDLDIEMDGGINASTCPEAGAAGVEIAVAGSAVFGSADYRSAIETIRQGMIRGRK